MYKNKVHQVIPVGLNSSGVYKRRQRVATHLCLRTFLRPIIGLGFFGIPLRKFLLVDSNNDVTYLLRQWNPAERAQTLSQRAHLPYLTV